MKVWNQRDEGWNRRETQQTLSCVWIVKYANVLVCARGECLFCFSISRWGAEQIGQVMNFSSYLHFFVVLTRVCMRWGGASLTKCCTGSGEEADHMSFSVRHRPTGARVDGGAQSKCCCALEKIQYIMLLNAPFLSSHGFSGIRGADGTA